MVILEAQISFTNWIYFAINEFPNRKQKLFHTFVSVGQARSAHSSFSVIIEIWGKCISLFLLQAITNPDITARKKIRHNLKKREAMKRKTEKRPSRRIKKNKLSVLNIVVEDEWVKSYYIQVQIEVNNISRK